MYTIDDQKEDFYDDEDYEESNWNNRKGLIFKIIIIILCIIVLIWLIMALKGNKNTNNTDIHEANVEKVRLAAEEYFFLRNNKDTVSNINLSSLQSEGLIGDIVDANDKVCSPSASNVNLEKKIDSYRMTVALSCSTKDQEEVFHYDRNPIICLDCSGKTHMDGKEVVIYDIDPTPTPTPSVSPTIKPTVKPTPKEDTNPDEKYYSCKDWSSWTKVRVVDSDLLEKVQVLVTGVKPGKTTKVYGDWSEYSTNKKTETDGIEVEKKVVEEESWSDYKTGVDIDTSNPNIRIVSSETRYENTNTNTCSSGFAYGGSCYSNYTVVGNLTYREYNSGNYLVKKEFCEGAKTLMNSEGLYVLTYINCEYNTKLGPANGGISSSYTVYTYQEKTTKEVKYYRYRTVETVKEADHLTAKKYLESELPEGFTKLPGSEEVYYSYKLKTCEK